MLSLSDPFAGQIDGSAMASQSSPDRRRTEMPRLGVWEWLIILVIVLVIFGASRLRDVGKGLGGAVTAFRTEVKKGREEGEGGSEGESESGGSSKAQELPRPATEPPPEEKGQ
jgi:sec-independent protein translocase protein TatA